MLGRVHPVLCRCLTRQVFANVRGPACAAELV